ncbi:FG-GAP-like repeat-containing protein [Rhodopirellula sp. MGV]|uniref:FG-GAP-like repeat-containing protein n=1 Tax=Rhodopirellula sp. MGV TaxID=2023130 RepID=UPI000B962101|nr:FG-GAP-like repeat-containing protein [Rhodopirellula sp. MGV]OYP37965.1 hypothetical protein CGZ80_03840 [Rhodopirellula sp. MGV]PNY34267.1 hypothetical protein C2E31_23805 [Rhodopirellula baltica]
MSSHDLFKRGGLIAITLLTCFVVGCDSQSIENIATDQVVEEKPNDLSLARRRAAEGNWQTAGNAAIRFLVQDPENHEAILIAAESALRLDHLDRASELAKSIGKESPLYDAGIDLRARALFLAGRASEAADVLVSGIEVRPQEWVWHHRAWGLLTRVGRREEASQIADRLCLAGEANEMELNSLIRRTEAFPTKPDPAIELGEYFEPGLGLARWHFTQLNYPEAIDALASERDSGWPVPAASALYGRLLAETQQHEQFVDWHAECDRDRLQHFGDYWAAIGTYFFDTRHFEDSAAALLNAVYQNPTDRNSTQRLAKVFDALGKSEQAQQYRVRGIDLAQCENTSNQLQSPGLQFREHLDLQNRIMKQVLELERPFEVLGWASLVHSGSSVAKQREIIAKRQQLLQTEGIDKLARDSALLGEKRSGYSLGDAYQQLCRGTPQFDKPVDVVEVSPIAKPHFENVASTVGADFQWYRSLELDDSPIPIHESIGGAIAIVDFDLDGWPDVYLAQGSGEPPTDACTRSNVLLHNHDGKFIDRTVPSITEDFNYGSGIAAGDVNQDGFIDLWLGSLGRNRLLINNGDGTFRDATVVIRDASDQFTASLAIADLNGDSIPDLFECDYIEMEGAFALPKLGPDGLPSQPSPLEHYAQSDRWFSSRGDGTFQLHTIGRDIATPGTALGVVVTNFDPNDGNEIFVGNDVRPNHLLVYQGDQALANAADAKGVANGFEGAANGCMGIASGDFNRDGTIDLHITNFSEESANLYLQASDGGYTDFATRYGIKDLSLPMVGFGTKALDIDRDGWLDLAVTNGHIFDMRPYGNAYQMRPQLLMNHGIRFELTDVTDKSGYWQGEYLGRSMAKSDFDRDGDLDLWVNHLDQPLALLQNRTETSGSAIQLELIGTTSERDAIGTRVDVFAEGNQWSDWVTAGDGYLCSDEPVLDFGIGKIKSVEHIDVKWPSGMTQHFAGPFTSGRYLIVESADGVWQRSEPVQAGRKNVHAD